MKLRATGERILVEPILAPKVSRGGIHLDVAYQAPSGRGVVISVGAKIEDVKPGDQVSYRWAHCTDVPYDGKTFGLVSACDIIGIVEEIAA